MSSSHSIAGPEGGAPGPPTNPGSQRGRACDYATQSVQGQSWGPPKMQDGLCTACWLHWKKICWSEIADTGRRVSFQSPEGVPTLEVSRSARPPRECTAITLVVSLHEDPSSILSSDYEFAHQICKITLQLQATTTLILVNCAAIKAECELLLNSSLPMFCL